MKFKLFLSAMLALAVSSSAIASSPLGQLFGQDVDHRGTQCTMQEKVKTESSSSRSNGDSDRDSGRAADARAAT